VGARAEAVFLEAVASEVRGGASLRSAIVDAIGTTELDLGIAGRLAAAGRPMDEVAAELRVGLAVNGSVAGPALALASRAGSSVATLFDSLALRAGEAADDARERRTATAQARLSALLVGGAPTVAAAAMVAFGDRASLATPAGATIAVIGFGLQGAGALVVWRMVRGNSR
jgi:Flp pilus assembly protein TadB